MIDKSDMEKEGIDVNLEGYTEFHKYWTHKIEVVFTWSCHDTRAFTCLLTGSCCC
jgi:hypothetical protein